MISIQCRLCRNLISNASRVQIDSSLRFGPARVRELLWELREAKWTEADDNRIEHEAALSPFIRDFYGANIISLICAANHPSNFSYSDNYAVYEDVFFTVLET